MEGNGRYAKALFAAGCFWDVEAAFITVEGVLETVAGYCGGSVPSPTYEQVESGTTGHAEAVGIVFDPAAVSYDRLLDRFWEIHDPTQSGGQGGYTGSQYRSAIFWYDEKQRSSAAGSRDRLAASEPFRGLQILTEILPAPEFWPADECHQRFYEKCGQAYAASRQIYE